MADAAAAAESLAAGVGISTSEAELVASDSRPLASDDVGLAAICCTTECVVLVCARLEIFVADATAGVGIPPTLWATGGSDGSIFARYKKVWGHEIHSPLPENPNDLFESSLCIERAARLSDGTPNVQTGRSNLLVVPNGLFESRSGGGGEEVEGSSGRVIVFVILFLLCDNVVVICYPVFKFKV